MVNFPPNQRPEATVSNDTTNSPITIPHEYRGSLEEKCWRNKVVLLVESEHTPHRLRQWLSIYNIDGHPKLHFWDELVNSMYVVQIGDEDNLDTYDKSSLLARSPLVANGVYASVNNYNGTFNQVDPVGISHLVSIQINEANPAIYLYMHFVVSKIGKLV
jgi:hypothetical protein